MRARLRRLLVEWGVPVAVGLPLAAAVIALGDLGGWLLLGLVGLFFGAAVARMAPGPLPPRIAAGVGVGVFAVTWPPALEAVANGTAPAGAAGHAVRAWLAAPALAFGAALVRRITTGPATPGLPPRLALALAAALLYLPLPWLRAPAPIVLGGVATLLLAASLWRMPRAPGPVVELDGDGVRVRRGERVEAAVRWEDLVAVDVVTTSGGPMLDDLFWLLHDARGGGVVVPSTSAGELLARLGRLPGFDFTAVVQASGSTDDARFPCWAGRAGDAAVCAAPAPPVTSGGA